jgi:hypothetical protein
LRSQPREVVYSTRPPAPERGPPPLPPPLPPPRLSAAEVTALQLSLWDTVRFSGHLSTTFSGVFVEILAAIFPWIFPWISG